MNENLMMNEIKRLQEELMVLHAKDQTIKISIKLAEMSDEAYVTKDMSRMATSLLRDLDECRRNEEVLYLRHENQRQREEIRELKAVKLIVV